MTVMKTVSQVEDQIVGTIKSAQQPAVDTVRRVASVIDERLPNRRPSLPFRDRLPGPAAVVDNGFGFARKLLDTQHEFTKALVDAASPLLGAKDAKKATSTKSTKTSA